MTEPSYSHARKESGFIRHRRALAFLTRGMRMLPRGLLVLLWTWSSAFPGSFGIAIRYSLARARCASCGTAVVIEPGVHIAHFDRLTIGHNVSIRRGCYIDAVGGIQIDDNVSIAHQTSILSFEHTWLDSSIPIRENPLVMRPVHVHTDVWIGAGCRILAGVTIGTRSVIAAGAVVTKNVDGHTVVGGVPARVIKILQTQEGSP